MTADDFRDSAAPERSGLARMLLGVAALLAIGLGGWAVLRVTGTQTVSQLRIAGHLDRVRPQDIDTVVRPLLDTRFIEVDLNQVHAAVAALSWIARVRVERAWPATVRLHVWEREPVARWGDHSLLDLDAQVFDPGEREVPADLPLLSGAPGTAPAVIGMFRRMQAQLGETPLALSGLHQDARGDWTGITATDIELRFGRSDPTVSLPTLLGPVLQTLSQRLQEVAHVDLRYTNGFSVGWREPSTATQGK
jgi:cell division protein FtsQ